ncbi:DUF2199 domain-containing protein [Actinoplanes solisilvae]|uniref:DUF2199 domain-containing protein n=1 Tax=Actinoplanes solisilvae TaxID=2486853 RepID=UPI000FDBAB99|nr:DUF2199 domain-containing protein [Actinoplanes solisilvae]
MTELGYVCGGCGQRHDGLPFSYGSEAPVYWSPELEDDEGSTLEQEICIIRAEHYFVRARLIIPVVDADKDFDWGVWVSLSRDNFKRALDLWESDEREKEPSYFGWLSTELPGYPSTVNLKTRLHNAPVGVRPHIELEPTQHPLAVEQRNGITVARIEEIAAVVLHA